MTDKKSPKDEDKPKITVVDRRHSMLSEETEAAAEPAGERLPSYVEKLKKDAEEKDKRLREYIAAYKENTSATDELRARLSRENENRLDLFKANLFARLLPILDNLKRAAQAAKASSDYESLNQGIQMVIRQYTQELADNGVKEIVTEGRKFDPKTDEAFLTVDTQDPAQDNAIIEELEPGYTFKDKLIKAAKVKVAKFKE